ncbi:MAG TPA: YegS/Rv2252/BmrU family lipid kinase [Propionibacteriaceae bacterium]|nr:YegS/Rv2252/BmrU family lipid kinase [Propionibacteriaceae bacterium]
MAWRYDGPTITLVVNPAAGRGRARRLLPKVCSTLLTELPDAHLRVHQATSFADARMRTIQAVETARPAVDGQRPDALVVMGGDGMAHLGVNACATTDVTLGVIPAGSGNDFCRGVGIPSNVHAATRAIGSGRTRLVDATEVRGHLAGGAERRFVGAVVSTGYDAKVNRRANDAKLPLGPILYLNAALSELAVFEPLHYRLTIDGGKREIPAMIVCVANTQYFGGGMKIAPTADPGDGLLDLTIVHPVSRATLLRLLPMIYTGGFVRDPAVERLRAREVILDGDDMFGMGDGEELGDVPLTLRNVPGALRVHVA